MEEFTVEPSIQEAIGFTQQQIDEYRQTKNAERQEVSKYNRKVIFLACIFTLIDIAIIPNFFCNLLRIGPPSSIYYIVYISAILACIGMGVILYDLMEKSVTHTDELDKKLEMLQRMDGNIKFLDFRDRTLYYVDSDDPNGIVNEEMLINSCSMRTEYSTKIKVTNIDLKNMVITRPYNSNN